MSDGIYHIFAILMVASCRNVMGREFMSSPAIEHWIRALAIPDDCTGATAGDKVTDPDDCTKFFLCIGPDMMTPDSYPCTDYDPAALCFDPATKDCSAVIDDCNTACTPTPSACKTACGAELDDIADITDCNRHFLCLDSAGAATIELYCPADRPYFDGTKCTDDKSSCCNCQPETCVNGGDLLPDPLDCHSLYTCVVFGTDPPVPVGPIPCEDGGSFVNGACDAATTECETACDLGGSSSTTSTTLPDSTPTTLASSSSSSSSSTLTSASSISTSTTTTTPSSTTTPSTSECTDLSSFSCPRQGYFARCPFCDPSYFKCDSLGAKPTQGACSGDMVFNPKPEYPYCIQPGNCPYPRGH